ncbi:MAG TPA: glycosyltransferase family 4 protein [Bryobacteraceae bacterium]|nr:glycosyltransferase family 4 protein [Bryobacteraceae bacterium]
MRVLQVGPYPPPHGGVQTHLVAIRDYLRQRQIPCAVVNITRHRQADADEVYYPKSAVQLIARLMRLRYDVLHLHIGGDLPPRLLGLMLACTLLPRRKTVLTFHSGGYPSSPAGQRARPGTLRGLVFRRLDGAIAVNDALADLYRRFGIPESRIRLIPPHAVRIPAGSLPPAVAQFFETHTPRLLTVGLLEPEYDLLLQIEMLGEVRKLLPGAGLAIIGAGTMEAELKGRIAAHPQRDHILLCGDVPHSLTLGAIAACDVFLRTTRYDGDSISVREALHLGTPVVATDNRMRPEGVRLIPIGDLQALCRTVIETAAQPREHSEEPGEAEDNVAAVVAFYRDLLNEGAGR